MKEAELNAEQRRLANFLDFVGEGRGSRVLAAALVDTERKIGAKLGNLLLDTPEHVLNLLGVGDLVVDGL